MDGLPQYQPIEVREKLLQKGQLAEFVRESW